MMSSMVLTFDTGSVGLRPAKAFRAESAIVVGAISVRNRKFIVRPSPPVRKGDWADDWYICIPVSPARVVFSPLIFSGRSLLVIFPVKDWRALIDSKDLLCSFQS